jgi:hypothetical protein
MFWSKDKKKNENDEVFEKIVKLLKIVETEIARLDKEVEMLSLKMKSKFYGKTKDDDEEEKKEKDDGFTEVRKMQKSINNNRFGL